MASPSRVERVTLAGDGRDAEHVQEERSAERAAHLRYVVEASGEPVPDEDTQAASEVEPGIAEVVRDERSEARQVAEGQEGRMAPDAGGPRMNDEEVQQEEDEQERQQARPVVEVLPETSRQARRHPENRTLSAEAAQEEREAESPEEGSRDVVHGDAREMNVNGARGQQRRRQKRHPAAIEVSREPSRRARPGSAAPRASYQTPSGLPQPS